MSPIDQPPAIVQPAIGSGSTTNLAKIPNSKAVLVITADGKTMRDEKEIKDLSKEELLVVIDELVDLLRKR